MDVINNACQPIDKASIESQYIGKIWTPLNAPQGFLINGKIVRTVASNNLTVAIKTLAGNDPSIFDPVYVRIGNTVRSITTALSVTANAATNWLNSGSAELATKEIDYFVYLGWQNDVSAVRLVCARTPNKRLITEFNVSANNENGSINTYTAYGATDEVECIGRFNATLSAGAGYTWSIPATDIIINRPIFETRELSWNPASKLSGYNIATYKIVGDLLTINFQATSKTISSGATTDGLLISTPFSFGANWVNAVPFSNIINNGSTFLVTLAQSRGTQFTVFKTAAAGNWAGGETGVSIYVSGSYKI